MGTIVNQLSSEREAVIRAEAVTRQNEQEQIRRNWTVRVFCNARFVWVDLAILLFSLAQIGLAAGLRSQTGSARLLDQQVTVRSPLLAGICLVLWSAVLWVCGLYRQHGLGKLLRGIAVAVLGCATVLAVVVRILHAGQLTPVHLSDFCALSMVAIGGVRSGIVLWSRVRPERAGAKRNIVILGSGKLAEKLAWQLQHHSQHAYRLGFVDSEPQPGRRAESSDLGGLNDLEDLLMANVVDEVHVALPLKSHYAEIQEAVRLCGLAGVDSHYMAELFPTNITKNVLEREGRVVMSMTHSDSRVLLKRALDVTVASTYIALSSPLLVLIALLVRLSGPGPIVFRQIRYGCNKRPFTMFSFAAW